MVCSCCGAADKTSLGCSCTGGKSHICLNVMHWQLVERASLREDVIALKWRAIVNNVCASEKEERTKVFDCVKRRRDKPVRTMRLNPENQPLHGHPEWLEPQ